MPLGNARAIQTGRHDYRISNLTQAEKVHARRGRWAYMIAAYKFRVVSLDSLFADYTTEESQR